MGSVIFVAFMFLGAIAFTLLPRKARQGKTIIDTLWFIGWYFYFFALGLGTGAEEYRYISNIGYLIAILLFTVPSLVFMNRDREK